MVDNMRVQRRAKRRENLYNQVMGGGFPERLEYDSDEEDSHPVSPKQQIGLLQQGHCQWVPVLESLGILFQVQLPQGVTRWIYRGSGTYSTDPQIMQHYQNHTFLI